MTETLKKVRSPELHGLSVRRRRASYPRREPKACAASVSRRRPHRRRPFPPRPATPGRARPPRGSRAGSRPLLRGSGVATSGSGCRRRTPRAGRTGGTARRASRTRASGVDASAGSSTASARRRPPPPARASPRARRDARGVRRGGGPTAHASSSASALFDERVLVDRALRARAGTATPSRAGDRAAAAARRLARAAVLNVMRRYGRRRAQRAKNCIPSALDGQIRPPRARATAAARAIAPPPRLARAAWARSDAADGRAQREKNCILGPR